MFVSKLAYPSLAPISGHLAGLPGFTHESRALFALTMCARWNSDLSPGDQVLFRNLQLLLGSELSYLCDFIGTTARFFATVIPLVPVIIHGTIRSSNFTDKFY